MLGFLHSIRLAYFLGMKRKRRLSPQSCCNNVHLWPRGQIYAPGSKQPFSAALWSLLSACLLQQPSWWVKEGMKGQDPVTSAWQYWGGWCQGVLRAGGATCQRMSEVAEAQFREPHRAWQFVRCHQRVWHLHGEL